LLFNLNLALRAIRTNRLRSVLTIVIIGLGIMALVAILTASEVLKSSVNTSFSNMGANTFQITSAVLNKSKRGGGGIHISTNQSQLISYEEASAFKERYAFPSTVGLSVTGTSAATVRKGSVQTNPNIRVMGVDEHYLAISETKLLAGRNFSPYELQRGSYSCIIGSTLARKLFGKNEGDAPGSTVSIGNIAYYVAGVMEPKGGSMMMDANNLVLLPLQNARAIYGGEKPYLISVTVKDAMSKSVAAEEAEGLFRNIRKLPPGTENNFAVNQNNALIETLMEIIGYISWTALVIGIITVLGSVIGLMNIMLVSVAERTREIGVSKALGARSSAIKAQFLTESVIISLLGGSAGIVSGILMGNLVSLLLKGSFVIPWIWIMMAVSLCAIVGITSGLYPAVKASRLDPIDALRYE